MIWFVFLNISPAAAWRMGCRRQRGEPGTAPVQVQEDDGGSGGDEKGKDSNDMEQGD